ncbi:MAG TPA: DUF4209 domain-containing protein [Desulfomonilaceae bacterium]|nr:DUF4209 domain-containing protein [Desulfomonilaceae bacterium]
MSELKELTSLYNYLEDHALEHPSGSDIAKLFDDLRKKVAGLPDDEVLACDWEAAVFRVHFEEGDAKLHNFEKHFDKTFHRYLKRRLNETRNPLLKAYYSHSLWVIAATKHEEHARTAAACYLELLRIFEKKTIDAPEGYFGFHLLLAAGNAFSLAFQTNFRWDEVRCEIRRLVIEFDFANPASFNLRRGLILLMIDSRRKLKREDFEGVAEVCWRLCQDMVGWRHVEVAIEALEFGEKVDGRLGLRTHDWISEKASCYEKLMGIYQNTPNELMHCQNALMTYKQAKRWDKVQELKQKYPQIRTAIPVATFSEEIDLTDHQEICKQLARKLMGQGSEQIIAFLMSGTDLLPNYSSLQETAKSERQETHIIDRLPTSLMDSRGHVIQRFSTPDELEYFRILQHYKVLLELDKLVLLEEVVLEAFRDGKMSGDILLKFLENQTWLGSKRAFAQPGGQEIEFRWLDLVAPSVHECQRHLAGISQEGDWVLCVDSLTLKLEGLLREFCDSYGITTFCTTTDSKGRQISMEKDLNALLHEDALKQIIDQDDLMFFKFLLVEHAGYNLRNKIAHCLIVSPKAYSRDYAILSIVAILRLAKYPLGQSQSPSV